MNRLLTWACLTIWFTGALVASAADDAKKGAPKIDPKADVPLHALSDALAKAKTFSVDLTSSLTIQPVNQSQTNVTSLVIDRAGRMAAILKSGDNGATIVNDGKNMTVALPVLAKYMIADAPPSITEAFPAPLTGLLMMQGLQFVAPLWTDKPYDSLIDGVDEVQYVGEEDVDGAKCHHLTFVQEPCNVEMWITKGDSPRLQKITPDMAKLLSAGGRKLPPGLTLQLDVIFENWNLSPTITDKTFTYTPPADMEKVDTLFPGMGPHPLQGKPAPDFEVSLLDGSTLSLSSHKGKNIVVVDFWATWCGPCVQALPTIIEVTDSFKDKGVVFYAMNLREENEVIKAFLEEKKLAPKVALDVKGDVATKYGVEGIPQTVIIDKEGVARVVHVGASEDLKLQLTKELQLLLDGKDPLGEKAKK